MELTPEGKQKISEEEKARVKAQERSGKDEIKEKPSKEMRQASKKDATSSSEGCGCTSCIIFIAILAIIATVVLNIV